MHNSGNPWLQGEALNLQLSYWKQRLSDGLAVLELPVDHPRSTVQGFREKSHPVLLSDWLTESIGALSRGEEVSLFTLLLAAFQVLLHRYTGQREILVGSHIFTPRHSPPQENNDRFYNTLLLRVDVLNDTTFQELLHQARNVVEDACSHHELPFEQLAEVLQTSSGSDQGKPLFQVSFALRNSPLLFRANSEGVCYSAASKDFPFAVPKLDLNLVMEDTDQGLKASFEYNGELFEDATIFRIGEHLQTLLKGIVADQKQCVSQLPILTETEQKQLLVEWNDTKTEFPDRKCLHHLFEEGARERPDAVGVLFDEGQVTYSDLNRRSNQLAHHLRSLGVGPEVRVGICTDRTLEMVVGILGVLKAGGAYVPLDPAYPTERLTFMLRDAQVSTVLTLAKSSVQAQPGLTDFLSGQVAQMVLLDADWETIGKESIETPRVPVDAENLAYVIYTSGSTGRPKGISLRHRGVVNNLVDLNRRFSIGTSDRVLAISSLSFDMCVYEVLGTLAAGGAIVMPQPSRAKDPAHWAQLLVRHKVSVWNSAPQLLELLVDYVESRPDLHPIFLRVAILGGDWVPLTLPDRLKALAKDVKVFVLGGATEASIHSTVYPVDRVSPSWKSIPYGRPMANQHAYILDDCQQPVPVGVPGELHLGGVGLARGYFGRPDLTAEKFIPNPFSPHPGERLYKTGDLARYMLDGNIELIGRMDYQVKIRGHRIELAEIAAILKQHPAVQDAVLLARDEKPDVPPAFGGTGKTLVAYVVPRDRDWSRLPTDTEAGQIEKWREIYEQAYMHSSQHWAPTFNFAGWISSYGGRPFTEEEMREWVDRTVERIFSLRPSRVLEIGCGTGLVLFRIAPHCVRYDATDFSQAALVAVRQQMSTLERELSQVNLWQCAADDFKAIEAEAYDAVILNSITQHFPNVDYLTRVMEGAVNAVHSGGFVFVGDVRSLPLMEAFHTSIELYGASPSLAVGDLLQLVRRRDRQEKELFVDPDFFPALQRSIPKISHVAIRLKRARHPNELSKFHYDVILSIGAQKNLAAEPEWLDWQDQQLTLAQLRELLIDDKPEIAGLRRIPDARLMPEVMAAGMLSARDRSQTVYELLRSIRESEKTGVDPEDLCSLAGELSYSVDLCWSGPEHLGCFDAVLQRADADGSPRFQRKTIYSPGEKIRLKSGNLYANRPVRQGAEHQLTRHLRSFLQGRLPQYMLPSAFVILDKLPLNPNGKVDRRALPAPEWTRPDLEVDLVAPRDPVEEAIAAIWSEVLGLERIGVYDNFFELGGHSLTAIQIVSRLQESFQIEVPLRVLFSKPTVSGLAEVIRNLGRDSGMDVVEIAKLLLEVSRLSEDEVRAMLAAKGSPQ